MHRAYRFDVTDAADPRAQPRRASRSRRPGRTPRRSGARIGPLPGAYPTPYLYIRKMACSFGWDWGPTTGHCRHLAAGRGCAVVERRAAGRASARPSPSTAGTGVGAGRRATWSAPGRRAPSRCPADRDGSPDPVRSRPTDERGGRRRRRTRRSRSPVPDVRAVVAARARRAAAVRAAVSSCAAGDGACWTRGPRRIGFRDVRLDTGPTTSARRSRSSSTASRSSRGASTGSPTTRSRPGSTGRATAERLAQAARRRRQPAARLGRRPVRERRLLRAVRRAGPAGLAGLPVRLRGLPRGASRSRSEVEAEARENVARLMPHPSLVLWNGNNENIWGCFDWGWQERARRPPVGRAATTSTCCRGSSPRPTRPARTGRAARTSGSLDLHPNDPTARRRRTSGTCGTSATTPHYRDHAPRFVAEFGWQAPPAWATLRRAPSSDDPLDAGLARHAAPPEGRRRRRQARPRSRAALRARRPTFDDWHFLTQLNQARAVTLRHRALPVPQPTLHGHGLWQLNDCWPAVSWSLVDCAGRRKPLWYALRRRTPRGC